MIVADTNLLIYLYIQGQRTAESEAVLQRDPSWAVPLLWRSEFRNVLIGLVRRDVLSLEAISAILEEAERWLTGHGVQCHVPSRAEPRGAIRLFGVRLRVCCLGARFTGAFGDD